MAARLVDVLPDTVRAAVRPVAHMDPCYDRSELERFVRDKVRDAAENCSVQGRSAAIACQFFVFDALSSLSKRKDSRDWMLNVDWETLFLKLSAVLFPEEPSLTLDDQLQLGVRKWRADNATWISPPEECPPPPPREPTPSSASCVRSPDGPSEVPLSNVSGANASATTTKKKGHKIPQPETPSRPLASTSVSSPAVATKAWLGDSLAQSDDAAQPVATRSSSRSYNKLSAAKGFQPGQSSATPPRAASSLATTTPPIERFREWSRGGSSQMDPGDDCAKTAADTVQAPGPAEGRPQVDTGEEGARPVDKDDRCSTWTPTDSFKCWESGAGGVRERSRAGEEALVVGPDDDWASGLPISGEQALVVGPEDDWASGLPISGEQATSSTAEPSDRTRMWQRQMPDDQVPSDLGHNRADREWKWSGNDRDGARRGGPLAARGEARGYGPTAAPAIARDWAKDWDQPSSSRWEDFQDWDQPSSSRWEDFQETTLKEPKHDGGSSWDASAYTGRGSSSSWVSWKKPSTASARTARWPKPGSDTNSAAAPGDWKAALETDTKTSTVRVNLSRKGLTDYSLQDFCSWARSNLPDYGVVSKRSDGDKPPRFDLEIDASENSIGDDGVEALVTLLIDHLRGVRVAKLKLHKNYLGPRTGAQVRRLLEGLAAERPREWHGLPWELHLSHNKLGREGLKDVLLAVARAKVLGGDPAYPLPSGRNQWQPLWLRLEQNMKVPDWDTSEDLTAFLQGIDDTLAQERRAAGWFKDLPDNFQPPQVCIMGLVGQARCSNRYCAARGVSSAGPVAHVVDLERAKRLKRPDAKGPQFCPWQRYQPTTEATDGNADPEGSESGSEHVTLDWREKSSSSGLAALPAPAPDFAGASQRYAEWSGGLQAGPARQEPREYPQKDWKGSAQSWGHDDDAGGTRRDRSAFKTREISTSGSASQDDHPVAEAVKQVAEDELEKRGLHSGASVEGAGIARSLQESAAKNVVVVLSATSISKTYSKTGHLYAGEANFYWDAIRSANAYYRGKNITTLIVLSSSQGRWTIPNDLVTDVIIAPEGKAPGIADQLMLRLAMSLQCQFIENGDNFREEHLPPDLRQFARDQLASFQVKFDFFTDGFAPRRLPPQSDLQMFAVPPG